MLLVGVPIGLFPTHTEEALIARNVVRIGAGVAISPRAPAADLSESLERVLKGSAHRSAAAAFASKYPGYDPRDVVTRIADTFR
jgi:UDP:flavonoid glycosyltransferase YjiC (YdhE family)